MFSVSYPVLDLTQSFLALSRRVSASHAHFKSGDMEKGMQQLEEAIRIIEEVERANVSSPYGASEKGPKKSK